MCNQLSPLCSNVISFTIARQTDKHNIAFFAIVKMYRTSNLFLLISDLSVTKLSCLDSQGFKNVHVIQFDKKIVVL